MKESGKKSHKLENTTSQVCDDENLPHITVKEQPQNRKYKWEIGMDFIFLDENYKLDKESLEEVGNLIEEDNITHRLPTGVPLGEYPMSTQFIEVQELENAKKIAEALTELAENRDNWVKK